MVKKRERKAYLEPPAPVDPPIPAADPSEIALLDNSIRALCRKVDALAASWAVDSIKIRQKIEHLGDLILDCGIDTDELAGELMDKLIER